MGPDELTADADDPRVADAMLSAPVRHPVDLTIAQARAVFADRHVHLLLLVDGARLVGTLDRDDVASGVDDAPGDARPALERARLAGRTVAPDASLEAVRAAMTAAGQRRRAVVDDDGTLRGLLALKASGAGFCDDAGVAARARARRTT